MAALDFRDRGVEIARKKWKKTHFLALKFTGPPGL
jgi:hypothetical protein